MGSIRKKETGKGYEARYRDPSGRSRSKTLQTKAEARQFLAVVESSKVQGSWTNPRLGRMTFGDLAKKWLDTKDDVEERTLANIEGRIRNHYKSLEKMKLADIRPSDIVAWRSQLKARLSNDTVNSSLGTLRQIFRLAVMDGVLARNPAEAVEPLTGNAHKKIVPLTVEQTIALAEEITPRYRALVLFDALGTGLRAGELWALRLEHVNFLGRKVTVRESLSELSDGRLVTKSTKTGRERTLGIDQATVEILARHIEQYPSPDGLVFTSPGKKQVRHGNFMDDHFMPAIERLGDKLPAGLRFHDLRHTHASLLIARGWRPEQVKDRLGHGTIRTTYDRYGHLFEDHDTSKLDDLGTEIQAAIAVGNGSSVGNPWEIASVGNAEGPGRRNQ